MGTGPLTGVRVLDLTQYEAGTVCTETLAWMGADVLKVERPGLGDPQRYAADNPGVDTYGFLVVNMNKRSVTCNMKHPEGIALIRKLLAKADVLVENFGPGAMDRLGLSYEECRKVNDKIIYASIKGFNSDSPYRNYPAFDPIATHMGGLVACSGKPDEPIKCGYSVADSGSGMACAMAVCAALYQRSTQGIGQRIEVAMQDFIIGLGRASWEPFYHTGKPPKRVANGMPLEDVAPANTYPCKPGGPNDYLHINCSRAPGSPHFAKLCRIIGREDLIEDPRMETPQSRYLYREELDAVISEWTLQHTKQEAMKILCEAGIPAGAMFGIEDIAADDDYVRQGVLAEVDFPGIGVRRVPGFAPRMSENHIDYAPSPALGGDNETVYGDLLGLSREELERLKKDGAI